MDLAPQSVSVGTPFFEGCRQQLHEIKILGTRNRKNPIAGYLAGSPYFCKFDRQLRMPQRHMFGYQFDVVKAYVGFMWLYMILWMPLMEGVFILPPWHLTSHTVQRQRSSSKHVQTNKGLTVEHPNLHDIFTYIYSILSILYVSIYIYIYLFDIVVFSRIQSHSWPPQIFPKSLAMENLPKDLWGTWPSAARWSWWWSLRWCPTRALPFGRLGGGRSTWWRMRVGVGAGDDDDEGRKGIPTWEPCVFFSNVDGVLQLGFTLPSDHYTVHVLNTHRDI